MLLKMTFHQSFFRLDARLTFPQARLRQSQPRLQEYWFFVLGAIFNSELSFQFCWFLPFQRNVEWKHWVQFVDFSLFKRKLQSKRFLPQIWRKNLSSTSISEEGKTLIENERPFDILRKWNFRTCINDVRKET